MYPSNRIAMPRHWVQHEARSEEERRLFLCLEMRWTHEQYLPYLRAANERRHLYGEWTKSAWEDPVV